jgi:hypothetical protein
VKRLNGMDAMLLYSETPNLHTHTLKVAIVDVAEHDGEFDFDVFRHTLLRRLHRLDPLRYKLVDMPWRLHHPMWLQNCEVDLDYHLHRVQVPSPGGRRELDEVIEKSRLPRWIAVVRCGSSTSPKAWPDTDSQSSGSCTTPWPTGWRRRIYWLESWTWQGRRKMSATMTRPAYRRQRRSCCGPRRQPWPVEQVQQRAATADSHHQCGHRSADFGTAAPDPANIVSAQANPTQSD